ncbi:F0F1 ATP synthase subunit A [Oceanivirga salmonicida]|uniref:F0F1 ATP synthase subunit A n=1 Tax=Oceanivirga salmonicida TaxID=1769291 RepID=UPI001E441D46|nr:FoF1 ATP synthase subunit a [Oceanivirga salmonicida]
MLKKIGILFGITLVVNFALAIITTVFPIEFIKPESIIEGAKIFYTLHVANFNIYINQTVVNTWVLMVLITTILYFGTKKLSIHNPSTIQLILEEYYRFIETQFLANYRKYKRTFMPMFSALFSFILFANLSVFLFPFVMMIERHNGHISVVPFFRPATADINTTLGLALVVTVVFVGCGIKREGVLGVLRSLCKPFIFMFPINLIGELAKPINISMRLLGNMFAGIVIVGLLYSISFDNVLSSWTNNLLKGSFSFAVGWPAILQLYLDLFIGTLQAFVFTILSSVYVEQALIGDEEE